MCENHQVMLLRKLWPCATTPPYVYLFIARFSPLWPWMMRKLSWSATGRSVKRTIGFCRQGKLCLPTSCYPTPLELNFGVRVSENEAKESTAYPESFLRLFVPIQFASHYATPLPIEDCTEQISGNLLCFSGFFAKDAGLVLSFRSREASG